MKCKNSGKNGENYVFHVNCPCDQMDILGLEVQPDNFKLKINHEELGMLT